MAEEKQTKVAEFFAFFSEISKMIDVTENLVNLAKKYPDFVTDTLISAITKNLDMAKEYNTVAKGVLDKVKLTNASEVKKEKEE